MKERVQLQRRIQEQQRQRQGAECYRCFVRIDAATQEIKGGSKEANHRAEIQEPQGSVAERERTGIAEPEGQMPRRQVEEEELAQKTDHKEGQKDQQDTAPLNEVFIEQ